MYKRTFCDWLMERGVQFPPDTVIVNADAVSLELHQAATEEHPLHGEMLPTEVAANYEQILTDNPTIPPYDTMFVEFAHPKDGLRAGMFYTMTDTRLGEGLSEATAIAFNDRSGFVCVSNDKMTFRYDVDGIVDPDVTHTTYALPVNTPPHLMRQIQRWPVDGEGEIAKMIYASLISISMLAFHYMHSKREVELMDAPPKQVKRAERRGKKQPSPYFRIIETKPVKSRGTHYGRKQSNPVAHRVRGHFRVNPPNHPLPQFAGKTLWIPAHQRGKGDAGSPRYTIRM